MKEPFRNRLLGEKADGRKRFYREFGRLLRGLHLAALILGAVGQRFDTESTGDIVCLTRD